MKNKKRSFLFATIIFAIVVFSLNGNLCGQEASSTERKMPMGWTSLHYFASQGLLEKVRAEIEKNPLIVNARDRLGRTPLYYAVSCGHFQVGKLLVKNGGDPNARESYCREFPLHLAARMVYLDFVKLLIESGAKVDAKDGILGRTALHRAVFFEEAEVVKILLKGGARTDVKDDFGLTPTDLCASPSIRELLEKNPKK